MITPRTLPNPPSTTIAKIMTDRMKSKLSGVIVPCLAAKIAPASPAMAAPTPCASTFSWKVSIPQHDAASSSSRIAAQARPTRERPMRTQIIVTDTATASTR